MEKRNYKILSIDGGGIKGLYSLYILKRLEEKYDVKIYDSFDMICGTSTGGIIALGIAINEEIEKIIEFYENNGSDIFPKDILGLRTIKSLLFKSKYDNKTLKKHLVNFFGDKKIKDCKNRVCIQTTNLETYKPFIIKTKHNNNWDRDDKFSLVDVALATSAAPTYFPIASIENGKSYLADGGLFANNPAMIGYIEAKKYFLKDYSGIEILSIGNISDEINLCYKKRKKGLLNWGKELISVMMTSQSTSIAFIMKHLFEIDDSPLSGYVRIENNCVPTKMRKEISLDKASEKAYEYMKELANTDLDNIISNTNEIEILNKIFQK